MSEQKPDRRSPKTYTVLGLFALFIGAVIVVLVRRLFPGRISKAVERAFRRHR